MGRGVGRGASGLHRVLWVPELREAETGSVVSGALPYLLPHRNPSLREEHGLPSFGIETDTSSALQNTYTSPTHRDFSVINFGNEQ